MGDFVCDAMLDYIANQVCGYKCAHACQWMLRKQVWIMQVWM